MTSISRFMGEGSLLLASLDHAVNSDAERRDTLAASYRAAGRSTDGLDGFFKARGETPAAAAPVKAATPGNGM